MFPECNRPAGRNPESIDRREGFLVGAVVGAALAARTASSCDPATIRGQLVDGAVMPLAPPAGRRRAAIALADELLVELTGGGVDLHRLARRWVDWADATTVSRPTRCLGRRSITCANSMRRSRTLPSGSVAALAAALPAALAGASPRGDDRRRVPRRRHARPGRDHGARDGGGGGRGRGVPRGASRLCRRTSSPHCAPTTRPDQCSMPMRTIPRDPRTPPPVPRGETARSVSDRSPGCCGLRTIGRAASRCCARWRWPAVLRRRWARWPARCLVRGTELRAGRTAWLSGAGEDVERRRAVAGRLVAAEP